MSNITELIALRELLQLCKNNSRLEKIKIDLGEQLLEEETCGKLCELIESKEMIQVLELPSLNIGTEKLQKKYSKEHINKKISQES